MKKSTVLITVIVLFLLIAFAASLLNNYFNTPGEKRDVALNNDTVEKNISNYKTIGLIASNMQDRSIADIFGILKDYSKENENIKILLFDSEARADKQALQLDEFIDMKVDGIVINPVNNSLHKTAINKLKDSRIPAILIDSNFTEDYFLCSINSSSEKIGETQAEFMAEKLNGKGQILVFTGSPDDISSVERLAGFKKIIGRYPGIKFAELDCELLNTDKEFEMLYNIIKGYERIDGIVLQQNNMSLQIRPLLERMDIDPVIIGVDTVPDVLVALKDGEIDASAYISSSDMAEGAFDAVMKAIKKEHVPKQKIIPHKLITVENIDDFIENNLNYKIK